MSRLYLVPVYVHQCTVLYSIDMSRALTCAMMNIDLFVNFLHLSVECELCVLQLEMVFRRGDWSAIFWPAVAVPPGVPVSPFQATYELWRIDAPSDQQSFLDCRHASLSHYERQSECQSRFTHCFNCLRFP